MFETIQGSVQRIVFQNQDTGFKVLRVKLPSGPVVAMTGEFGPEMIVGAIASFHGQYKTHPKYGTNFKVNKYDLTHNVEELASIKLFLVTIAPNIGPERAEMIVTYFGKDLFDILDNWPNRLTEVAGVGKISARSLAEAWAANKEKWQELRQEFTLRAFLYALNIKERRVKKILAHFGGGLRAESEIRENPYILTELEGFGFSTADFVAKQLGLPEDSQMRVRAFIYYMLEVICPSHGHLYFTRIDLTKVMNQYCLEHNTQFLGKSKLECEDLNIALNGLAADEKVIIEDEAVYSKRNFDFEARSAYLLTTIIDTPSDLILHDRGAVEEHIATFERESGFILSEEQKTALYFFVEKKVYVITGAPGTGKCLGINTPVMMYDGSVKKVQDIVAGDLLMGDDSTPREVKNICRGRENLYKITPKKGDSYVVNESHILSLKETTCKHRFVKGRVKDIALKDFLNISKEDQAHLKGYRMPLEFKSQNVPIDPYLIGFWLGNGNSAATGISTPFKEALEHISSIIKPLGLSIKKIKNSEVDYNLSCDRNCGTYKNLPNKRICNPFLEALRNLNLIHDKHIPHLYKINDKKKRLKLLAGIIDSDGYADGAGISITFKSKKLMDDTVFLARSLGFSAYPKEVTKRWNCISKGKHYEGVGQYYMAHISGNHFDEVPIKVGIRHPLKRSQIKDVLVTGIKITPMGAGDYYGFEIDGNGRFLLGDFTVTHNTTVLRAIVDMVKRLRLKLTCMTPTGISAKKMENTVGYEAATIHRKLGFKGNSWDFGETAKFETDVVIIDEGCLPYRQFVDLADGTKRYIGTIVHQRQPVEVLSYNQETKKIEPQKVTDWFKYPRKKVMYKIKLSYAANRERQRILRCTESHKIYMENGQKTASELKIGDLVLVKGLFLNQFQKSFLFGTLLGDAYINNRHSGRSLQFVHGQPQEQYIQFKAALFHCENLRLRGGYKPEKYLWTCQSRIIDNLDDIYGFTYPSEKKTITQKWLDQVDEIGLAAWYMDDGSLLKQKGKRSKNVSFSALFHTEGFNRVQCDLLVSWLKKRWNIDASVYSNGRRKHHYIRLTCQASIKFWGLIVPWVIPSMKYKFPSDYKPSFTAPESSYLSVALYPVRQIRKYIPKEHYKSVYDICVENNHNYFSNGVLISNSMVDQEVFYRLLAALRERVHLILVGDNNQLPSVGAGNVLRELINCRAVPIVRLEQIFRQDEASDIIKVAHKIKNGDTDLSLFKPDPTSDVFFLREPDISKAEQYVIKLAQKFKGEKRQFQIITPRNEGPLSVSVLNKTLQEVLNPPSLTLPEMQCKEFILRKGDRVRVKKNDYENLIYNGDIGKIIDIGGGRIYVEIDSRLIMLSVEEIDEKLKLAYCLSVHGAQGQEYDYIILPFINQFGRMMLQRNLLYTAITRAKTKVIVIGHGSALEKAINNSSVYKRNTKLGERVCQCLAQKKSPFSLEQPAVLQPSPNAPSEEGPSLSSMENWWQQGTTD